LHANQSANKIDQEFTAVVGAPLPTYWKTFQLGFAKMLLSDTALPVKTITAIARLSTPNKLLKALNDLYGRDPLTFRKPLAVEKTPGVQSCALMLAYRPPLDWTPLMDWFAARAVAGVEKISNGIYRRSFSLDGHQGWFSLQHKPQHNSVRLEVHASDLLCLMPVVWRVRRMLGLDADPLALKAFFGRDPLLGPVWFRHAGLRVPVGWDAFEFAVRAVAGQLISIGAAVRIVEKIVRDFGSKMTIAAAPGIEKVFPGPADLQEADISGYGLTRTKAAAIASLAQAVINGTLDLDSTGPLERFIKNCTAIHGIGEWTAHTIAMRGLGAPDAFPASDLGIVKAMAVAGQPPKPARIRKIAERWRPWRAYAAMLLWMMPGK
jgi:AraC family transcriptional regulator of adaptative response / DNA-3-methyladenine glycosylase II